MLDDLREVAAQEQAWVTGLLQEMVRIPSVNGAIEGGTGEGALQAYLADVCRRLGCRVTAWEPDPEAVLRTFPGVAPSVRSRDFEGRPNLVAILPGSETGEDERDAGIILNSHIDTVGPGPLEAWTHEPFAGEVEASRVHGLGSVDAKGCLATYLGALRVLQRAGVRLRGSVAVQAVADEEWGGVGTLSCIERGYTAPVALVGEPTDLRICPGSRGSYGATVTVLGRKAHPGSPWDGVNAIDKALLVLERLRERQRRLDREFMHPLWAGLPVGHVWNAMGIISATGGRAIPDRCELHVGAGAIGVETFEFIRDHVEAAIAEACDDDDWLRRHPPDLSWRDLQLDAAVTDVDHPAVRSLARTGRSLGEDVPAPIAFSAGTDGRHLSNIGGIPSINFGPGSIGVCHAPNESLAIDELHRGTIWVAAFLAAYLGVEGEGAA